VGERKRDCAYGCACVCVCVFVFVYVCVCVHVDGKIRESQDFLECVRVCSRA
jgi:hypothetical protein